MRSAKVKKLRLTSETLRHLDNPALGQVVGGVTNGTNCPYTACLTSCNGCNTLNTCTTRYC
jgi:hypothetical protein